MSSDLINAILDLGLKSGLPFLLLMFAIKWLNTSNQAILTQLNNERNERITLLETHINECDNDRGKLRAQIIDILTRQVNPLTPQK